MVHACSVGLSVICIFFGGQFPEPRFRDVEHISSTLLAYIMGFKGLETR